MQFIRLYPLKLRITYLIVGITHFVLDIPMYHIGITCLGIRYRLYYHFCDIMSMKCDKTRMTTFIREKLKIR